MRIGSRSFRLLVCLLALAVFTAPALRAQEYTAQGGQVEVSGFSGLAMISDGVGNHPLFGGGLFVYANKYLSVGGDLLYSPVNRSEYGFGVTSNLNYYAGLGKVRVHFPTTSRAQPYVLGSIGAVRGSGSVRQGGVSYFDLAMTEIAYGGGGGFNTFITHRFGIRFEAAAVKVHQASVSGQVLVGALYRFGGE